MISRHLDARAYLSIHFSLRHGGGNFIASPTLPFHRRDEAPRFHPLPPLTIGSNLGGFFSSKQMGNQNSAMLDNLVQGSNCPFVPSLLAMQTYIRHDT